MATAEERLESARRAARHPRIVPTLIEGDLGTRFTVDTLAALHLRFPKTRFVWLMGADNLIQIPRWRGWQEIFESTPVAVFSRPPYCLKAVNGKAAHRFERRRVGEYRAKQLADLSPPAWLLFRNPLHPASATAIRERRARRSGLQPDWMR